MNLFLIIDLITCLFEEKEEDSLRKRAIKHMGAGIFLLFFPIGFGTYFLFCSKIWLRFKTLDIDILLLNVAAFVLFTSFGIYHIRRSLLQFKESRIRVAKDAATSSQKMLSKQQKRAYNKKKRH